MALDTLQRCKVRRRTTTSISANPVVVFTVADAVSIHGNLAAVCVEESSFF